MKGRVLFWVDGGMLGGKNPSPEGVFWSVYRKPLRGRGNVVIDREESTEHHTNNDAAWLALRAALRFAQEHHKGKRIQIYSDSQLIVKQFNRKWRIRQAKFHRFAGECWHLANTFAQCKVIWQPREVMVRILGH